MHVENGSAEFFAERRHAWLRGVALAAAALVLAITTLSAFIRLSHAGLGCSDWPQCYGNRLRAVQQGDQPAVADANAVVVARAAHRVVAMLALVAIATLLIVCFGARPRLVREGLLALALLAVAIGLAVLGRFTAGARAPAVAMGNLLGGLLMLALSLRLAARATAPCRPRLRAWAWIGAAVLLVQVAIGALVSASYAAASCAALDECRRAAVAAGWPWEVLDPWRDPTFVATTPPINPRGALAQFTHRGGALLALLVLAPLGIAVLRGPRWREGAVLLVLLLVQLGLGWLIVATALPLALVLAHNVVAGLLLATVVRLA